MIRRIARLECSAGDQASLGRVGNTVEGHSTRGLASCHEQKVDTRSGSEGRDGGQGTPPRRRRTVERIADRDAPEAEIISQQRLHLRRPGCRLGVESRVGRVGDHDDRHATGNRGPKGHEVGTVELLSADGELDGRPVGVARRPSDPWEVLHGGSDACPGEPSRERDRRPCDRCRAPGERPLLERHERPRPWHVGDRGEIHVHARQPERLPGRQPFRPDRPRLQPAERCRTRKRPGPREAAHLPTLLVGGDQQWRASRLTRGSLQGRGETAELGLADDVRPEEDHAADLSPPNASEQSGRGRRPAQRDHEPLANELAHGRRTRHTR